MTVLLLSACTGKNDFVLETVSQESGSDKMPGAEGDSGTEEAPDVVSEDSRHAGSISEENRPAEETAAENSIGNMAAEQTIRWVSVIRIRLHSSIAQITEAPPNTAPTKSAQTVCKSTAFISFPQVSVSCGTIG